MYPCLCQPHGVFSGRRQQYLFICFFAQHREEAHNQNSRCHGYQVKISHTKTKSMIISHFSKAKRIMQRGPATIHSPCSTHILILYCSAMCTSGERLSCRLCEHSSITHAHSMAQEEATHGRLGGRTAGATTVAEKWKIAQAVACKAGNLPGKVGAGLCSGSCHLPRTSGSARGQSRS